MSSGKRIAADTQIPETGMEPPINRHGPEPELSLRGKIILTGPLRSGKSTILKNMLRYFSGTPGGFHTKKLVQEGMVTGYSMCSFDGRERVFAGVELPGAYRVGNYGVDLRTFDNFGVDLLRQARETAGLIVMDELGIMELEAGNFVNEVRECFRSGKPILAVIQERALDKWLALIPKAGNSAIVEISPVSRPSV